MKYCAVIAAAGLSSRMKDFKPLMKMGDSTIIDSVISRLRHAGVEEIVVVTGYNAEKLESHLEKYGEELTMIRNEAYDRTEMFDSICIGLKKINPDCDGVFITPGDVPLVKPYTISSMMRESAELVIPVCNGATGHPVLLRKSVISEILRHDGSFGLKGAIERIKSDERFNVLELAVEDLGILMDADTQEDYADLIEYAMKLE